MKINKKMIFWVLIAILLVAVVMMSLDTTGNFAFNKYRISKSPPQMGKVKSPPQMVKTSSPPQMIEIDSPPQMINTKSPPQMGN
ncbi:MAG: hypothetical protein ISS95_01420 [Candidatus Aenigmarchaeota archaeon]|nr:hypothetical protein [Candidatus Aenigmarchaeota archaeon]